MPEITYSVADEVFARFPGYVRGVVVARDVANGASPPELVAMLRAAERSVRERTSAEAVASHPRIASWREAYRTLGVKPNEFRSSVEAMARRALRGDELPSINALVDIGNVVSLRHLLPAGGHAIDVLSGDIALRPATGDETFVAFGSETTEHPTPGEIVFVEGSTVLTRRWTWRQATHTILLPATTAVAINVDGLPPVEQAEVEAACDEAIELALRFCGGTARRAVLSRAHPRISLAG